MVGVGLLELYLVVVQQFRRLVFSPNINNNISLGPNGRISGSDNLRISELFGILAEEDASKNLVAVEPSIMSTYLFHVSKQSIDCISEAKLQHLIVLT